MDVEQADIEELAANVRANGGPAHLIVAHPIHGPQLAHILGFTIKLDPRVTAGKLQVV